MRYGFTLLKRWLSGVEIPSGKWTFKAARLESSYHKTGRERIGSGGSNQGARDVHKRRNQTPPFA